MYTFIAIIGGGIASGMMMWSIIQLGFANDYRNVCTSIQKYAIMLHT